MSSHVNLHQNALGTQIGGIELWEISNLHSQGEAYGLLVSCFFEITFFLVRFCRGRITWRANFSLHGLLLVRSFVRGDWK